MDQEGGFLTLEAELFFLGVTEDFFSLTIFFVGCGNAVVVNSFPAGVEGAFVLFLSIRVVRGILGVTWL